RSVFNRGSSGRWYWGHSAAEVARFLGISRMGVQKAVITCPPSRAQGSLRRGGRGGREFGRHDVSLER
ncbi:MAG: hypothetical protein KJ976_07165, partial [Proteobacteria bacterium]|nr:hypothetical protein [Pseudomonadota bacterium]